ncbi:TPA: hypothetical protein ACHJ4H_RS11300 [Escherichia coli]|uniref:Uncharacterized protein n=1 Tax=Shigella flexneri serotype 5a (strain M90T) TaxID=1086030 RepID=A0A4P7TWZ0_SHIFM|nr:MULTISPECIES: hypothetical protein [Enterobacteriaceae]EEZ9670303.1 hypothetical protein [Escherichia coli]EFZ2261873.1 hypothetical protein [Shigella flexneri]EFZ2446684.1 hypothetical protein [Shigella flexneri]EFZ2467500.1 hypothetical protein [Shigella flexneri]EGD4841726.1 hypothetical protein [Shigella flexneri]
MRFYFYSQAVDESGVMR